MARETTAKEGADFRLDPSPYWTPLARMAIRGNEQRVLEDLRRKAETAAAVEQADAKPLVLVADPRLAFMRALEAFAPPLDVRPESRRCRCRSARTPPPMRQSTRAAFAAEYFLHRSLT